jgi:L-2,4-diaminobutyric acid acetyltransferase
MPSPTDDPAVLPVWYRAPRTSDASRIWRLARATRVLEENSGYAYALLCTHFADTCTVAGTGTAASPDTGDTGSDQAGASDALAGFVVGYRPPAAPDTLFVWQVAVASGHRGRGLGVHMLVDLLSRPTSTDVRYLEATVTPSNEVSQRLFRSVARRLGARCDVQPFFPADLLPEAGHEPEHLYRIGPLPRADAPDPVR